MIDWRILAVVVPLTFVSYQSLSKLLPGDISVFLVNAYASLVGLVFMLILHLLTQSDKDIALQGRSLWVALGAGILISLGNYGIIKSFSLGAPQSEFSPIFYITLIIYGVLFGLLFFKESLNIFQIFGVLLAISGVVMVFYFKK